MPTDPATNLDLAQHIRALSPEKDAARLSFYHYLVHLTEPTDLITSSGVNRFFVRALQFTHWQANKTHLFEEVYGLLGHFQKTSGNAMDLAGLWKSSELQAVNIENVRNLELAVSRHLEPIATASGAHSRVIRDGDERVVGVVLNANQTLRVTAFPKVLAIRGGELLPLHDDFSLNYTGDLNLQAGVVHELDLGSHATARFKLMGDGLHGHIVRGYTFQSIETLAGGNFEQHPALFYPLKRLEQFFIDRRTDPVYQDLTASLEKALDLVSHQHPEGDRYARWALERSRFAFEHIYSEDKLVRLIASLERRMNPVSALQTPTPAPQTNEPQQMQAPGPGSLASRIQRVKEEDFGIDLVEAAQKQNLSQSPTKREDDQWPEIRNLPL